MEGLTVTNNRVYSILNNFHHLPGYGEFLLEQTDFTDYKSNQNNETPYFVYFEKFAKIKGVYLISIDDIICYIGEGDMGDRWSARIDDLRNDSNKDHLLHNYLKAQIDHGNSVEIKFVPTINCQYIEVLLLLDFSFK